MAGRGRVRTINGDNCRNSSFFMKFHEIKKSIESQKKNMAQLIPCVCNIFKKNPLYSKTPEMVFTFVLTKSEDSIVITQEEGEGQNLSIR